MNITQKNTLLFFPTRCSWCMLFILMSFGLLRAGLDKQIPTTATNTIGMQYLAPYRKELKKFDTAIQSVEAYLQNNPAAASSQADQLAALYQERAKLVNYIFDHEILFTRFALNELIKQEPYTNLIDFNDYEYNLYVACSPFDKEKDAYKQDDHLLHHLAQHAQLKCGRVKWAKTLAMPTTDVNQLRRTQKVSRELLKLSDTNDNDMEKNLLNQLEKHLKEIKDLGLEDSFLSFWKDESVMQVVSNAPYATNSNFAPIIDAMYAVIQARNGNPTWLQETIKKLDKSTPWIFTVNWTSFLQDASMVMLGVAMMKNGVEDLSLAVRSLPTDASYLGGWKVLALPIIIPVLRFLTGKIIDFSLKKRMQKEYETFTGLCEKNKIEKAQDATINSGNIELSFNNAEHATAAQKLIMNNMPYCQVTQNEKILVVTLTAQEEREFRFSHPLMRYKTITTIVIPCLAYLIVNAFGFGTPALVYNNIDNKPLLPIPFTGRSVTNPSTGASITIPGTERSIPVPGCLLLPWHMVKSLTCIGMLPYYLIQHFWKTPQKSMVNTTQSIQAARKALLDFARLIKHVKQIQALLMNNQVIRENLSETLEELDAEKVVQQKISFAKKILEQNDTFLEQQGISRSDLNKTITYLEVTQHELSRLLDTLQAHVNETDDPQSYSWFSPTGFIKNLKLKIRFGSDDLLAAYKIMQSLKDTFAPWIEALGEIDRKVSEARLMKDSESKNVKFCFAEYEQQATPHLAATGLWLPHLLSKTQPEKIVANDLEIGKAGQASTLIVSGPTEGGKSTMLRTVAIAKLMEQTVGFVPALTWVATPCNRVLMSFNAADNLGKTVTKTAAADTQTGTSGFRDEVESIKHIVQEKNKLTKDQHALIIIDELFQKVQRSGEYFSYQVITQNFVNNGCLNLIVSHREQPKYLEQETAGCCKNWHFVLRQEGDKWVNTYRIEPGAFFRPHKMVTLQEILSNPEDAYNLQITKSAGLIGKEPTKPLVKIGDNETINDTCPISLDLFTNNQQVMRLACGHAIGADVFGDFSKHFNTCPLCNQQRVPAKEYMITYAPPTTAKVELQPELAPQAIPAAA